MHLWLMKIWIWGYFTEILNKGWNYLALIYRSGSMYIKILHFTLSPISCQGVSDIKGSPEIVDVARPQSTRSSNSTRLSSRKSLSLSGLTIADLHRRNFLEFLFLNNFFIFGKVVALAIHEWNRFFTALRNQKYILQISWILWIISHLSI